MLKTYREESPLATEVRRIVSKLKIARAERDVKSVMLTSASTGEGKSTVAAYLAIACSKHRGARTVLLDLDLRRPRVHELFGLKKRKGVADILVKKVSAKSCLKPTIYPNLQIITSGRDSDNVSELLNNQHLSELFAELRFYYDFVIIDAPPVIPVSDPLMLSSDIDGAIFVIKAGKTQKPVIHRALQLLKDARIEALGVVLNNMHHVLPYYYDYDYYHYEYYDRAIPENGAE